MKGAHHITRRLSSASVDKFNWEWMVFQSNYPLTSLSRKKIHIIRRCIPCQAINWTWSDNRKFPNFAENSDKLGAKFNFLRPVDMLRNGCQQPNYVHSSFYRHRKVVFRPRRLKRRHFDRKVRVRINQYKSLKGLRLWVHHTQSYGPPFHSVIYVPRVNFQQTHVGGSVLPGLP